MSIFLHSTYLQVDDALSAGAGEGALVEQRLLKPEALAQGPAQMSAGVRLQGMRKRIFKAD